MQTLNDKNSMSISKIGAMGLHSSLIYKDDILITKHVELIEPFKYPCRLDATMVLVCIDGEVDFTINLKRSKLVKNTLLVVLAGDIIQIHQVKDMDAYAVVISTDYLNDLEIDFRKRTSFLLDIKRNNITGLPMQEIILLKPYYDLLSINLRDSYKEQREILKGLIRAFSYSIISLIHKFQTEEQELSRPRSQLLFDKFISLLTEYHTQERSVMYYAEKMCLTSNYLSSSIKEFSGKSASEWINEYVITEAKLMLKNQDNSIQMVSDLLNFPTQSAFGKYFKQQTGVSPKLYRNEE